MSDALRPPPLADVPAKCGATFSTVRCGLVRFHAGPHEGYLTSQHAIVKAVWHDDGNLSWRGEFRVGAAGRN